MEDLSARHTPSPVRPASVTFYPKTPEPKTGMISPKKKVTRQNKQYKHYSIGLILTDVLYGSIMQVTFSNILLERNYLQMGLPDLSPGSKVDEEFNKIYNSSSQHEK